MCRHMPDTHSALLQEGASEKGEKEVEVASSGWPRDSLQPGPHWALWGVSIERAPSIVTHSRTVTNDRLSSKCFKPNYSVFQSQVWEENVRISIAIYPYLVLSCPVLL